MKATNLKITPVLYMKAIAFSGVQSPSVFKSTRKEDVSATHSAVLNETRNQEVGSTKL